MKKPYFLVKTRHAGDENNILIDALTETDARDIIVRVSPKNTDILGVNKIDKDWTSRSWNDAIY